MYANASIAQTKAFQTLRGQKGGLPLPPAEITYDGAAEWRATEGREKLIMFWIANASGVICVLNGLCPAIRREFDWVGQIGGKDATGAEVFLRDIADAQRNQGP